ncbi:aldolase/citrate lyase family protein [Rheinheimera sp.]|uniref:aldolase/citrate lyase family protein n=1 Tax=Rheinheimera sp. TaxID=1869214 RepID=UPI0040475E89
MRSNDFNLMLITNSAEISKYAVKCGVDRIFVDLEINGKFERQGHLDTLISRHSMSDVKRIRDAIGSNSELLVRLNPFFEGSEREINEAIELGADIIMLPMFRTLEEIEFFSKVINNRVKFVPLLETLDAANILDQVVEVDGVSEVYFGLNDLHREMNLKFMFQPLQNGVLEKLSSIARKAGTPFGFGGIARVGEGTLPAEIILSEHVRLNSSAVILSRTFHRNAKSLDELIFNMDMESEIQKIRSVISKHHERTEADISNDKLLLDSNIIKIIDGY